MLVSGFIRNFANGAERIRSAEVALCSKLANGNVGNFQSKADNSRRAERLPRIAWGCAPFHVIRFSYDLRSELAKAVLRFCYGDNLEYLIIKDVDYEETAIIRFDAAVEAVADYIMGNAPTGFNKDTADVNNDNKVNAADIVLINKMIMK